MEVFVEGVAAPDGGMGEAEAVAGPEDDIEPVASRRARFQLRRTALMPLAFVDWRMEASFEGGKDQLLNWVEVE